ncbi:hypothetical protein [Pseudomonas sp. TE3610]
MLRKLIPLLLGSVPMMAYASQETQFWDWFVANDSALYHFTSSADPMLDQLDSHLKQIRKELTFELGPIKPDGRREFVISADGLTAAFPAVEALYAAAPKLDHWQVIKYRPRRNPINTLTMGDHTFDPAKVRCLLANDGNRIGIVLMYDDYKQNDGLFTQASYLLLDEALGEYAVETQVGFVNIQGVDDRWVKQSFPMTQLGAEFDQVKQR